MGGKAWCQSESSTYGPHPPSSLCGRTHLGGRLEEQADGDRAAVSRGTAREEAEGQERTAGEHGLSGVWTLKEEAVGRLVGWLAVCGCVGGRVCVIG